MSWRDEAACRDHPLPRIFFPGPKASASSIAEAKAVCRGCPVQATCLSDQLRVETANAETMAGIYGGLEAGERTRLRRKRGVPGVGPGAVTLPVPASGAAPRHGTPHAYRAHGCRCVECSRAWSDEFKRWKALAS